MPDSAASETRGEEPQDGRPGGADGQEDWRSVPLDLRAPLARLGGLDGIYVVVENMPVGARLSAGRSNGDLTWSLAADELDDLRLIMPGRADRPFALTIRILTPDPQGYDFASTLAKFDLFGAAGEQPKLHMLDGPPQIDSGAWPQMVRQAYARHQSRQDQKTVGPAPHRGKTPAPPVGDRASSAKAAATGIRIEEQRPSEEAQLAALREEWRAEEALRLERAREDWDARWCERWRLRELELNARHGQALAGAEASWRTRESAIITGIDTQWSARFAAAEARWRNGAAERTGLDRMAAEPLGRGWRVAYALLLGLLVVGSHWLL